MNARTPATPMPENLVAQTRNSDGPLTILLLVAYVAGGAFGVAPKAAERTARFESVVERLRSVDPSYGNVLDFMANGAITSEGPMMNEPRITGGFHAAFNAALNDGTWTAGDTGALVGAEVSDGPSLSGEGAVSGYRQALNGPNADAMRAAFAKESVAQARAGASPGRSALLYAQATQALGSMGAPAMRRTLDELRAADPDAIAQLTYGAMGGTATLAQHQDYANGLFPGAISSDGLGKVIASLANTGAHAELVDAVAGVSTYLTEKTATPTEQQLIANDAKTGLRAALNAATHFEPGGRSNFHAILRSQQEGHSLSEDGKDLAANLARFELGGSAADAQSRTFARNYGNVIGHIAADLAQSGPAREAALRRDFGPHAFGQTTAAGQEIAAARTLGNLIGQLQNGLDQNSTGRAAMDAKYQETLMGTLEGFSSALKAIQIVAPEAKGLDAFDTVVDFAKTQVPLSTTASSDQAHRPLDALSKGVQHILTATGHEDLKDTYQDGLNDTDYWQSRHMNAWDRESVNEAARDSGGAVGRAIQNVIAPNRPEPAAPKEPTQRELVDSVRAAAKNYNNSPENRNGRLPAPSDDAMVKPWNDGKSGPRATTGTLLKIEAGGQTEFALYAVHNGRGTYTVLDPVKDLHGFQPDEFAGRRVTIDRNGLIEQNDPGRAPQPPQHSPAR